MHWDYDPGWLSAEKRKARAWAVVNEVLSRPTTADLRQTHRLLALHFDRDEVLVVKARVSGLSRDQYLSGASSEEERLRRQAAWKRVDRKGIPETLRVELRRASEDRLKRPEWEDRAERDRSRGELDDFNEFDP
jgi:hypothetical protein